MLALLAVLALVTSACAPASGEPRSSSEPTAGPTSAPAAARWRRPGLQATGQSSGPIVRLGAAVSLTGSAAMAGTAQRNGIKLAQDEINLSRELGNIRLEVIVEDDGSNREQAANVFTKFIENSRVLGILGPTLSDTALAVDPIAQQAGVPVLAVSNAAAGITEMGDFIFRDCLSEAQLLPQTVKRVKAKLDFRSAALLYTDTDTSRTGAHQFKKALRQIKVPITSEQTFAVGETDLSAQLAEIASTNPEVLFVAASPLAASQVLIQARRYGLREMPIVGSNGFNSSAVVRLAGEAAEGMIVGSAWSAANPEPRNQQFIQSYRNRYNAEPDQFAAQAYTGVYIMAAALKDSGTTTDPGELRDALLRVKKLDTPLGPFSFNANRDAEYPPIIQIVRNGRFELF